MKFTGTSLVLCYKLWTKYTSKQKVKEYFPGKLKARACVCIRARVCVYISADTVDSGFVWMKGNTFMVFEQWGPTPATLGSCYPLLCLRSWGNFNEYSCSSGLLAPVRLYRQDCTPCTPPSSLPSYANPPPPWLWLPVQQSRSSCSKTEG